MGLGPGTSQFTINHEERRIWDDPRIILKIIRPQTVSKAAERIINKVGPEATEEKHDEMCIILLVKSWAFQCARKLIFVTPPMPDAWSNPRLLCELFIDIS